MSCPKPSQLAAYARDEVNEVEVAALDLHLSSCRRCLNRFVEVGRNPLTPGIPGYHIVKEVGRGRFGVVYKAWRLQDVPAVVALKILSDPGDMEVSRFDREIAVLKKIDSPGIVRCIDSGSHGDLIYLVMDYVQGRHLDEYFKDQTGTLSEKLEVFRRVCHAVADAHERGVIHRDLKPKNIVVDDQGLPHILDFGICTVEQEDWSGLISATITQAGDIIGTLKYMSPEQAWGGGVAGIIDARSDIWSLGVILYEIVTHGAYPYPEGKYRDKPRHEALLEQIRKDLPEQPDLSHLPFGRELETLLERCLAWEPEFRVDSARQLGDDIGRYLNRQPIQTKPLWILHRLRRLAVGAAAQSRWMFTLCFVALLGVAIWSITFAFNLRWISTGADTGDNESQVDPALLQRPHDHMVIAGISDESIEPVVAFAAENGLEEVTADIFTWRRVHAVLMERLAVAKPRSLTFDYHFTTSQPADSAFVAGIEALERAGTPVVLASLDYDDRGRPVLSEQILLQRGRKLRHGMIAARNMVDRPGEFLMAIEREGTEIIPTLPLATFAAVVQPEGVPDVTWRASEEKLELAYEASRNRYLKPRDPVYVTQRFTQKIAGAGVRKGDLVMTSAFELDSPEAWVARTIPYERLLTADPQGLASMVGGKLILVGDLRHRGLGMLADRHPVKYRLGAREDVPGCYLLCDAIAGLFTGRHAEPLRMLPPATFLLMLLLATGGCLLPIPLARRRWLEPVRHRKWLWLSLLGLSVGSLVVMFASQSYPAVHTSMAGFSFFSPMIGSFWVEFARNRHRVLDNRRQAFIDMSHVSSGTLTLGLKPS